MAKCTVADYMNTINEMKWDAHNQNWLYIEVNAKDLNAKVEPGVTNTTTACKAIYDALLEGDNILVKPETKTGYGVALTVRYYCDNLHESRRKYADCL
ncbi:MAG: hypothetical protein HUJ58_05030 [Erysipelotrichaceae bacterium]|nr:hypothetical protein [Erysipelotrichaceae bacterium]